MFAARVQGHGDVNQLKMEEISIPTPKEGEVLIKVHSAGVNPVDWKIRKYQMPGRTINFPYTAGIDFSGVIESLGPGVKEFKVGQAVYGSCNGSYAEYTIAGVKSLYPKPVNISFDQAAAIPIGGRTAWIALFILGNLQKDQKLLVHGAAGGVGNFAVQLGHWKGAHVIGTASTANIKYIKSLGVELAIDYTKERFETKVKDVDIVLDSIGGEVEERSWQVIKPGGILITMVHPVPPEKAEHNGIRTASTNLSPQLSATIKIDPIKELNELITQGKIVPQVGKIFPLKEANAAQEFCEKGHGRGRIILHIKD